MPARDEDEAILGTSRRLIRLSSLVAGPVLVGVTMAVRWADAGENFYASIAQIIATLFVAMAIEFFVPGSRRQPFDPILIVCLLALSWVGFLSCIRALAGAATGVTVGLAGAGVTAASVLVSLSLYENIRESSPEAESVDLIAAVTVILFLVAPVLLFVWL